MTEQEIKLIEAKKLVAIAEAEFELVRMQKRFWDEQYETHHRKLLDAKGHMSDCAKKG